MYQRTVDSTLLLVVYTDYATALAVSTEDWRVQLTQRKAGKSPGLKYRTVDGTLFTCCHQR